MMESRILWWLESDEDVFYPSPGVVHFPLVREEDAPHHVLFLIPPPRRGWVYYDSDSEDSLSLSDHYDSDDLGDYVAVH